jgi:hypothetical protein
MSSGLPKPGKPKIDESLFKDIEWTGRSSANKIVNFYLGSNLASCGESFTGRIVNVEIEKAFSHSLWGKYLKLDPAPFRLKGEESYAA